MNIRTFLSFFADLLDEAIELLKLLMLPFEPRLDRDKADCFGNVLLRLSLTLNLTLNIIIDGMYVRHFTRQIVVTTVV